MSLRTAALLVSFPGSSLRDWRVVMRLIEHGTPEGWRLTHEALMDDRVTTGRPAYVLLGRARGDWVPTAAFPRLGDALYGMDAAELETIDRRNTPAVLRAEVEARLQASLEQDGHPRYLTIEGVRHEHQRAQPGDRAQLSLL